MGGNAGPTTSTRGVGIGRGLLCLVRGQTHRGGMEVCRACFAPTRRLISCTSRSEGGNRSLEFFSLIHTNTIIWSIQLSRLYFIASVNRGSAGYSFEARGGHGIFPSNGRALDPIPKRVSSHDGAEFDPVSPRAEFPRVESGSTTGTWPRKRGAAMFRPYACLPARPSPTVNTNYSELVRAMLPSRAALGLMVLRCVARSTATIPNLGSNPDIHSKLSSSDQAT